MRIIKSRFRPIRSVLFTAAVLTLPAGLSHAQVAPGEQGNPPDIADAPVEPAMPETPPAPTEPAPSPVEPPAEPVEPPAESLEPLAAPLEPPAGREAPAPTAAPTDAFAGYKGGFYLKTADGDFVLKATLRLETRFNAEITDGTDGQEVSNINFRQNRTRVSFSGHAYTAVQYKIQLALDKSHFVLKDAYADSPLRDEILVRYGLWKQPFSRQFIGSSATLTLVDRSILQSAFNPSRDIGVGLHNNYEESPDLEWIIGIQNGQTGDANNIRVDVDLMTGDATGKFSDNHPAKFSPSLVARVGVNTGRDAKGARLKGYSEADLEGGPTRIGVAAGLIAKLEYDDSDEQQILGQVDYILKHRGFSSTGAFYIDHRRAGDGLNQYGFHLQASRVLGDVHLAAARFAMVSVADPLGGDRIDVLETAVGHSYYFKGHRYKLQTDLTVLDPGVGDFGDVIGLRSQVELMF